MKRRPARDGLRRDLESLGTRPTPAMSASMIDAIEARLRSAYDTNGGQAPSAPSSATAAHQPQARHRRRALVGTAIVTVTAIVAIVVAGFVVDDGRSGRELTDLTLTAARHAYIVLPDGTRISAETGTISLPVGSRLVVGFGGTLTVDGITLAPGESATVAKDSVRIDVTTATDIRPGDTSPGATNSRDDNPNPSSAPTNATDEPSVSTTVAPETSSPAPTAPTGGPATTAPTAEPPSDVRIMRAGAEVVDVEVRVRWAQNVDAAFGAYVVLATYDGSQPQPGTEGVSVEFSSRDRSRIAARLPFVAGMRLRVIAFSADRVILAASRVLIPSSG